jgi:nucleoid DNA-binding protein
MNTTTLINLTAEETGQSQAQTEATLNAALIIIRRTVASGKEVILPDFGTFKARHIFDKDEINPESGDPASDVRTVKFLPAPVFRAHINHRLHTL